MHAKDSENSITTMLGCKHSSAIEDLMKQFVNNFSLLTSKKKKRLKMQSTTQGRDIDKQCTFNCFKQRGNKGCNIF
jgi:hypothetical protein